jgi:ABC-2 type transport system ATP-binding protein
MSTVLQTRGLAKHFGPVRAVDGVDLVVRRGEVFGFLGPNGSGKTTTIGMLLGLIRPTAGEAELFGEPVSPQRTRPLRRVGALVGAPGMVPYLSGRDNLRLLAHLNPRLQNGRVDAVLAQTHLSEASRRKVAGYSTGMKQRLGLAAALLHGPELLILDEPTNGLDPAGMREVRDLIGSLAAQGVTVFLSSHLLHEVEQICDRVAALNKGKVVAQGPVAELLSKEPVLRVRITSPQAAVKALRSLPGISHLSANGAYVEVRGPRPEAVIAHLVNRGLAPREARQERPDLESLFLKLTEPVQKKGGSDAR